MQRSGAGMAQVSLLSCTASRVSGAVVQICQARVGVASFSATSSNEFC
jgi:hypothetical protein